MFALLLIALITTSIEMTTCLICTRRLGLRRNVNGDNARFLLSLGSLLCGLLAAYVLVANLCIFAQAAEPLPMLHPWVGLVYISMHIIMTLYPIAIVRPTWLTPIHYIVLFSPVAFFAFVFLFFVGNWTEITTPESVWENASNLDVTFRLMSLFIIVPYCLILFWLPYNYKQSSATLKWIIGYSFGLTLICGVHIVLMLTYTPTLMALLPLLAATFYYQSTEFELHERLRPPHIEGEEDILKNPHSLLEIPMKGVNPEFGLWSRIQIIMDKEEGWRDPDLSLTELAHLTGTNISYLNRIIKQEAGMGFKDYLNQTRIRDVEAQLRANPRLDIQEAFFNAGFRSRTTAWRNFKDIIGVTPSEFKQSLK